jgi:hypothetical protein
MNKGYMLFIRTCSVFWKSSEDIALKQTLKNLLPEYQFLGICAVMWRFLPLRLRIWWTIEIARPTLRKKELLQAVRQLAAITVYKLS